ncbi:hypothetical protein MBLNU459_g5883t2 [Dothideomycetes sp. NU459]
MLNVRALNTLLTENVDHKLFQRWFIMTPNGSLMAYTTPANMKELRDQVALVSISWKENLEKKDSENFEPQHSQGGPNEPPKRVVRPDALETLTIEFDNRGVPPGRKRTLRVTAEAPGDPRYPPDEPTDPSVGTAHAPMLSSSVGSKASTTASAASFRRLSVLQIQRKKTEMMTRTIKEEFKRSEFLMPDDPTNKFF